MAIKNIIAMGIGFNPNQLDWIVTHGFGSADVAGVASPGLEWTFAANLCQYTLPDSMMQFTFSRNVSQYTLPEY